MCWILAETAESEIDNEESVMVERLSHNKMMVLQNKHMVTYAYVLKRNSALLEHWTDRDFLAK